jgi:hypothetical protein
MGDAPGKAPEGTITRITTANDPRSPDNDPRWLNRWGAGRLFIERPYFRDRRKPKVPEGATETAAGTWSGITVFRDTLDKCVNSVEAVWTVPNCYPPKSSDQSDWYTCSSWIGIDGGNSVCLEGDDSSDRGLQVGVDSNVMQHSHVVTRWACAWWEWYPGPSKWIPGFPVAPGDRLDVIIAMEEGSKTRARIHLLNRTSGVGTSFPAWPDGKELIGNCAEWIVEKTAFANSPDKQLASYGEVWFHGAKARTSAGDVIKIGSRNTRPWKIQSDLKHDVSVADTFEVGTLGESQAATQRETIVRCKYIGPTATKHIVPTFVE